MARESLKARELKRERLVAKYAEKRAALKAAGDYEGLDKLPKNSSPVAVPTLRLQPCRNRRRWLPGWRTRHRKRLG